MMLNDNDHKGIWHAIDWNVKVEAHRDNKSDEPSDEQLKKHFDKLLNLSNHAENGEEQPFIEELIHIPLTDDPLTLTTRQFHIG